MIYTDIAKIQGNFLYRILLELELKNDRFCSICSCAVNSSSKHCIRCGRCTYGFDHHCKWVNNCIGAKNYHSFILLIITVELYHAFLASNYIFFLDMLFNISSSKLNGYSNGNIAIYYSTIVLLIISVCFCGIIIIFDGYLLCFHMYISIKGITTYQFIVNKTNKIEGEKIPNIASESNYCHKEDKKFLKDKDSNLDQTEMMKSTNAMKSF